MCKVVCTNNINLKHKKILIHIKILIYAKSMNRRLIILDIEFFIQLREYDMYRKYYNIYAQTVMWEGNDDGYFDRHLLRDSLKYVQRSLTFINWLYLMILLSF